MKKFSRWSKKHQQRAAEAAKGKPSKNLSQADAEEQQRRYRDRRMEDVRQGVLNGTIDLGRMGEYCAAYVDGETERNGRGLIA